MLWNASCARGWSVPHRLHPCPAASKVGEELVHARLVGQCGCHVPRVVIDGWASF